MGALKRSVRFTIHNCLPYITVNKLIFVLGNCGASSQAANASANATATTGAAAAAMQTRSSWWKRRGR
jgi:hypothetical protein